MAWRVANSLNVLLYQIDDAYPDRSKDSDGSIGDSAHQGRVSDHDPDAGGVVRARDYTHDPAHGFNSYYFADRLLAMRDPRIKYVISNRRIFSGAEGPDPWDWRSYNGENPHDKHVHVSVVSGAIADSKTSWAGVIVGPAGRPPIDVGDDDMPDQATFQQWVANGMAFCAEQSEQFQKAIRKIVWLDTKVTRDGAPDGVPALQELADAKTLGLQNAAAIQALADSLASVPGVDVAALAAALTAAGAGADAKAIVAELGARIVAGSSQ